MDKKRYFGRLKAPEEAVADIKTQRSAASKQRDLQRLLQKHRYALQKEDEAIANYERRIELLEEMKPNLPK